MGSLFRSLIGSRHLCPKKIESTMPKVAPRLPFALRDFEAPAEYVAMFADPGYSGPADGRLMTNPSIQPGMAPAARTGTGMGHWG